MLLVTAQFTPICIFHHNVNKTSHYTQWKTCYRRDPNTRQSFLELVIVMEVVVQKSGIANLGYVGFRWTGPQTTDRKFSFL